MNLAILGTGSYGLSLAMMAVQNTKNITMWTPVIEEYQQLKETYMSDLLPGVLIDSHIKFTNHLKHAVEKADAILIVVPTPFLSQTLKEMKAYLTNNQVVFIGSKGLLEGEIPWIHHALIEEVPELHGIIAGPSFALDIAQKMPIGLTLGTTNDKVFQVATECFETSTLKLERSKDLLGMEICGTLKNIFAIGEGILNGLGVTESTQALYFNRAIVTTKELLKAMHAVEDTIFTHAGIGDMYLTMSSVRSRNYLYGTLIGQKEAKETNLFQETHTIEGKNGLKQLIPLLRRESLSFPLLEVLYQIIYEHQNPSEIISYIYQ